MILYPGYFQNSNRAYVKAKPTSGGPTVSDPNLRVEVVFKNGGKLDMHMGYAIVSDLILTL